MFFRLWCLICLAIAAGAGLSAAPALAAKRIAFVVGVDKFDNLPADAQLQRAVSDARAVAKTFEDLKYDEVISGVNVSRAEFNALWQKLLERTGKDDTVAVYVSSHGIEIDGLNYLVARDVPKLSRDRQEQLKRESLSVSELILDLRARKPRVTLLILDACRDPPFREPGTKSLVAKGGLAKMEETEGTFIMYSAAAGETALDRLHDGDTDANSVYTRKLLPLLKEKGLQLPQLARRLRDHVFDLAKSGGRRQFPAYYDGIRGEFCLAGCDAPQEVAANAPAAAPVIAPPNAVAPVPPATGEAASKGVAGSTEASTSPQPPAAAPSKPQEEAALAPPPVVRSAEASPGSDVILGIRTGMACNEALSLAQPHYVAAQSNRRNTEPRISNRAWRAGPRADSKEYPVTEISAGSNSADSVRIVCFGHDKSGPVITVSRSLKFAEENKPALSEIEANLQSKYAGVSKIKNAAAQRDTFERFLYFKGTDAGEAAPGACAEKRVDKRTGDVSIVGWESDSANLVRAGKVAGCAYAVYADVVSTDDNTNRTASMKVAIWDFALYVRLQAEHDAKVHAERLKAIAAPPKL